MGRVSARISPYGLTKGNDRSDPRLGRRAIEGCQSRNLYRLVKAGRCVKHPVWSLAHFVGISALQRSGVSLHRLPVLSEDSCAESYCYGGFSHVSSPILL